MIVINSNGSKWAGEQPDSIDVLLDRLATIPLDPCFEDYGNFVLDASEAYPGTPGATRFFGNFFEVSAVFNIDTDEPALVKRLTDAIRANQARQDYQSARAEVLA